MNSTDDATRPAGEGEFVIARDFDAPRDLVFRMWTECEHLMRWFGPKGFAMLSCTNDLRPGGVFHYGLRAPSGETMWGKWVHREIARPERLVFILSFADEAGNTVRHPWSADWPLHMHSTVTFAEQDGRTTRVTVRWSPHEATETERRAFAEGHESMRQGWTGTFDQLERHLARDRGAPPPPQRVIPYLTVRGAAEAIAFYTRAFGAEERMRLPAEDGRRLMHACLAVNGGTVFLSDEFPEHDAVAAPAAGGAPPPPPVAVVLDLASPAEVDATYRRALEAGAKGVTEPSDQFWGARFAVLADPFGHRWMLNAALAK